MKNPELWRPSKFEFDGKSWRASRNTSEVAIASRLIADIFAGRYEQALSRFASGSLLDHGCGKMPLYGVYRGKVQAVTAIDWENSYHSVTHADVLADLNSPLPFEDETFDTVLSSDVVEHLWSPVDVLAELSRVLKPNGHLIVGTPFNYWIHEAPHDYFRWTPFAVQKLADYADLEVLQIQTCGGNREVVIDTLMKAMRFRGSSHAAWLVDTFARITSFVNIDGDDNDSLMLGTVSVLKRRDRL